MYEVHISTDGSCIKQKGEGTGPAGWAAVIRCSQKAVNISGSIYHSTPNRAEMAAVIEGLKRITKPKNTPNVLVRSDSEYVVNTMTKDWRMRKNKDLWQLMLAEIERIGVVTFTWVKAHDKDTDNETADTLALIMATEVSAARAANDSAAKITHKSIYSTEEVNNGTVQETLELRS